MAEDARIQRQLDIWKKEYGIADPVTFMGFSDLGRGVLGRCTSWKDRSEVRLSSAWEGRSTGWMMRSVLWHEMCPAIDYQEDHDGDGHSGRWRELSRSNMSYRIGDVFAKLIVGPRCRR